MQRIKATIAAGETGPHVANLQDALLALLAHIGEPVIRTLDPPNHPTLKELQELTEGLREDRKASVFGELRGARLGTTRQLLRSTLGERPGRC